MFRSQFLAFVEDSDATALWGQTFTKQEADILRRHHDKILQLLSILDDDLTNILQKCQEAEKMITDEYPADKRTAFLKLIAGLRSVTAQVLTV